MYFDEETGLLTRLVRSTPSPVGRLPVRTDYSDYRDVAGVKMPFTWTTTWLDGRSNYELSEVQPNVVIDAAMFASRRRRRRTRRPSRGPVRSLTRGWVYIDRRPEGIRQDGDNPLPREQEGFPVKQGSFLSVCVAAALALAGPVWAHHGDAGRYIEEVVDVTGVVVETQLINPHSMLVFDVTEDGKTVRWQAEMGGAQGLIRNGWAKSVQPGTRVTLTGRRVKSGAPYMNMTERARIILADTGEEVLRYSNYGEPAPQ